MASPRLKDFPYKGFYAYSLTLCCIERQPHFLKGEAVEKPRTYLSNLSQQFHFQLWAYCFMPDHLHLLVEGENNKSDLQRFISKFKQMSGFRFKKDYGCPLWQSSYFEHVLRREEDLLIQCRYILENPVRAKLVKEVGEYPYSGSMVFEDTREFFK